MSSTIATDRTIGAATGGLSSRLKTLRFGLNLYQLCSDVNGTQLFVYKSTDQGLTWVLVDGLNGPIIETGSFTQGAWTTTGVKFFAASVSTVVNGTFKRCQVTIFDPSTDLWGTNTITTNNTGPIKNPLVIHYRASTSQLIILCNFLTSGAGLGRVLSYTFNTLTLAFTGESAVVISSINVIFNSVAIVAAGPGITLLLYTERDTLTNTSILAYKTLSDAGVLGVQVNIDSVVTVSTASIARATTDGTTIGLVWFPDSDGAQDILQTYTAPVATLVFTAQTIGLDGVLFGAFTSFDIAVGSFGTVVIVAYFFFLWTIVRYQDTGSGFDSGLVQQIPGTVVLNSFMALAAVRDTDLINISFSCLVTGKQATLDVAVLGEVFVVQLTAVVVGDNTISFQMVQGTGALSVAVVGHAITVTLADDGGIPPSTTTITDLVNILNATPAFTALASITQIGANPTITRLVVYPLNFLTGGVFGPTRLLAFIPLNLSPAVMLPNILMAPSFSIILPDPHSKCAPNKLQKCHAELACHYAPFQVFYPPRAGKIG